MFKGINIFRTKSILFRFILKECKFDLFIFLGIIILIYNKQFEIVSFIFALDLFLHTIIFKSQRKINSEIISFFNDFAEMLKELAEEKKNV